MALDENFTAEEQAQYDAMRDADIQPDASEPSADNSVTPEPAQPATGTEPKAGEAPKDEAQKARTIDYGAFHAEREKRKELETEVANERRKIQTLEERFNLYLQRLPVQPATGQPQQQPAAPVIPTVEQDAVGHIVGTQQQLGQNVHGLAQVLQAQMLQNQQNQAVEQLKQRAQFAEQEFKATTPDYDAAINFAVQKRNAQLAIAGVDDPAERMTLIQREALQLANIALQRGKNPASLLYDMAREFGYQTPAAAAPAAAQLAPASADPAAATPADKLATIAAGQEQARSLGNARGGAPAQMTVQRVLAMKPAEYAKWLDDANANPDQMHEIYGA